MFQFNPSDVKCQTLTQSFVDKLPLQTDPEEAQYINRLFLKQLNKQNPNLLATPDLQNACKKALGRMEATTQNNPELEILADDGLQLLKQTLALAKSN